MADKTNVIQVGVAEVDITPGLSDSTQRLREPSRRIRRYHSADMGKSTRDRGRC